MSLRYSKLAFEEYFAILCKGRSFLVLNTIAHDSQYLRILFTYRKKQPFAPHGKSRDYGPLHSNPSPSFITPVPDFLSPHSPSPAKIRNRLHSAFLWFASFPFIPALAFRLPAQEILQVKRRLFPHAPAHSLTGSNAPLPHSYLTGNGRCIPPPAGKEPLGTARQKPPFHCISGLHLPRARTQSTDNRSILILSKNQKEIQVSHPARRPSQLENARPGQVARHICLKFKTESLKFTAPALHFRPGWLCLDFLFFFDGFSFLFEKMSLFKSFQIKPFAMTASPIKIRF